ncbi:MAG: cytochrome c1 [Rhodospirillales bacterium]
MKRLILISVAAIALFSGGAWGDDYDLAAEAPRAPAQEWSFEGPFGRFDRAQLRRGFQVYSELCNGCHAIRHLYYRNLLEIGFTDDEVEAIAAEYEIEDVPSEEGEMFSRPALPSDNFVSPFTNEKEVRANNNGVLPPDLSLIAKARTGKYNYLYALLTGYDEEPEGFNLMEGMSFNTYFPGYQTAMPQPLDDDSVEYADGTEATLDQEARDVVAFLTWAASPELEERKRLGIKVMLFMLIITAMLYALKRRIWSDVH